MRYSQIKLNDIANSDKGINLSIWTQGCNHFCINCFNTETWDFNSGIEYTQETFDYICNNIDNYGVQRNLSILGGEPLVKPNIEGTINLCRQFKEKYPHKKIYVWTGYTYEFLDSLQRNILPYIDILIDGKFEESLKDISLELRGSSNQRVIDVKESLKENKVIQLHRLNK